MCLLTDCCLSSSLVNRQLRAIEHSPTIFSTTLNKFVVWALQIGSNGTKQWRYYDYGPKSVAPLVCLSGTAGTADVFYKQILNLCLKVSFNYQFTISFGFSQSVQNKTPGCEVIIRTHASFLMRMNKCTYHLDMLEEHVEGCFTVVFW